MDEREYRRNRSGKKKKSEGPISRYKRKMYGSINDPYCEAGTRVDPELFAQRDKERFNRFGDDSELEAILSAKSSTVTEGENLTPQQEAQINSVFQAGIPAAIVGSYGTALGTKTIWQTFGKVVAKRFGAVAAQALGLSVGDGILPVGDAIALGLLAVTAWQIARNWDELWRDVEQILVGQEREPQIYTTPDGELGTIEHTGHAPPEVETGTPSIDTRQQVDLPTNTGGQTREQSVAADYVMESRRDVDGHDDAGGHTGDRHIGKSDDYLRNRQRQDGIKDASTFTNKATTNLTQARFVKLYKKEIAEWLADKEDLSVFVDTITMDRPVGTVKASKGKIRTTNKAKVVLKKDKSDLGYQIRTSYPVP